MQCKILDRREFIAAGTVGLLAASPQAARAQSAQMTVAMLHLEPAVGDLDGNCDLYESAIAAAAESGADWILTPELGLTGYRFDLAIGTDWIEPGPDRWTERLRQAAAKHGITLFLGHLEMDPADGKRYNTVFVIDPQGTIIGRHRKINTIPVSEEWSTPGSASQPVAVGSLSAGILICADSWPPDHARSLADQGAEILVSCATWPPEPHGPETCWEQRTLDTGLPLFVCNRTGVERDFDIRDAESVVVKGGRRVIRHASEHSSILLVDWDVASEEVVESKALNYDPATRQFSA